MAKAFGWADRSPDAVHEVLTRFGWQTTIDAGHRLVTEGERDEIVHVIVEGDVEVSHWRPDGRRFVLGRRGPGALLGEAALEHQDNEVDVVALTRTTLWHLPVDTVLQNVGEEPVLRDLLLRGATMLLREADQRLARAC